MDGEAADRTEEVATTSVWALEDLQGTQACGCVQEGRSLGPGVSGEGALGGGLSSVSGVGLYTGPGSRRGCRSYEVKITARKVSALGRDVVVESLL